MNQRLPIPAAILAERIRKAKPPAIADGHEEFYSVVICRRETGAARGFGVILLLEFDACASRS